MDFRQRSSPPLSEAPFYQKGDRRPTSRKGLWRRRQRQLASDLPLGLGSRFGGHVSASRPGVFDRDVVVDDPPRPSQRRGRPRPPRRRPTTPGAPVRSPILETETVNQDWYQSSRHFTPVVVGVHIPGVDPGTTPATATSLDPRPSTFLSYYLVFSPLKDRNSSTPTR